MDAAARQHQGLYLLKPADIKSEMIRNIQLLRAVAAIMVCICHSTGQWGKVNPFLMKYGVSLGFTGVDLFFVISGFVITSVALRGLESEPVIPAVKKYSFNRVARIFPIYWIVLVVASVLSLLTTGSPTEGSKVTFLELVTLTGTSPALAVAWTLRYEVLFYAIIALTMFLGRDRFLRTVIAVFALYGAGAVGYSALNAGKSFMWNPIVLDFLWGAIVFLAVKQGTPRSGAKATFIGAILLAIGTYMMMYDPWQHVIARPFYLGLPAAILLYGMIGLEKSWSAGKTWVLLGDASYSIYLWHGAFFHQIRILEIKPYPSLIAGAVSVAFMVGFGVLSYKYIEAPIATTIKYWQTRLRAMNAH